MNHAPPRCRNLPRRLGLGLLAAWMALAGLAVLPARATRPAVERKDLPATCGSGNPFFVTTRFTRPLGAAQARLTPAIPAFRDRSGGVVRPGARDAQ